VNEPLSEKGRSVSEQSGQVGLRGAAGDEVGHPNGGWELLTVEDVARICGLSRWAIRRAIADGELAALKLRSRWRVRRNDLEAWFQACLNKTPESLEKRLRRKRVDGRRRRLLRGSMRELNDCEEATAE
jgi:excisionase family DNA binding protein